MKILGLWAGHDSSACLLEDGIPTIHSELERHTRLKHDHGDVVEFAKKIGIDMSKVDAITVCYPVSKIQKFENSWNELKLLKKPIYMIPHHEAHAAHAFYSSKFTKSMILTIDGGGVEAANGTNTATTLSYGDNLKLIRLKTLPAHLVNIGGLWTRVVRYIFKMQNGWPLGDQAGSVMALASFGNAEKYAEDFRLMLTRDLLIASMKPQNQPEGAYVAGNDPIHPYLDKWSKLADTSEKEKMDLAAGLQLATEELIKELIYTLIQETSKYDKECTQNLCIAGGVALNTVAMGKIKSWFPQIKEVYIPVCPGDSGLTIGANQYAYHFMHDNARISWDDNMSPYLGMSYSKEQIIEQLNNFSDRIVYKTASDDEVIELLIKQNIISIFNGRAESGHRALGNRSIICDPRSPLMKDNINKKVKHRQSYRPFAPSVLKEEVHNWFEQDCESPYMQFVLKFKEDKKNLVPAVCHIDGTGRLQTVTEKSNSWWYNFIKKWHDASGVPMLLNTSFNSQEPICEKPQDALSCFLRTDIDMLYMPQLNILVYKK